MASPSLPASTAGSAAAPTTITVVAAGLLGALGSALHVASVIVLPGLTHLDAARHPVVLIANVLGAIAFTFLAITLPATPTLDRLPRWALYLTAAGCCAVAGLMWVHVTRIPHLLGWLTEAQARQAVDQPTLYSFLISLPKQLLLLAGLIGLAVAGWRHRLISRGACVLLILAGLVSAFLEPPWPGAVLTGLALAWTARSARPASHTTV
ncbi:hypothetical protein [Nonomuraea basaltis]|uniref:hypothetical protein n=1 Tax=Nonomuraea basaltis TaxID=2495887 RepID=UPI00110C557B|nr:hypothetical protein [Nonomuraea basaltis]TMR90881.1 hypothetical protein EJK15_52895 [Nonomuraea basaltis]